MSRHHERKIALLERLAELEAATAKDSTAHKAALASLEKERSELSQAAALLDERIAQEELSFEERRAERTRARAALAVEAARVKAASLKQSDKEAADRGDIVALLEQLLPGLEAELANTSEGLRLLALMNKRAAELADRGKS